MPLSPLDQLDEAQLDRGLRWLIWDGVASQLMACLTGGAVLTAFALLAGASNTSIGLIAAIAPLSQIMQLPAVALVERVRRRKLLVVVSSALARPVWLYVALLPWVVPQAWRLAALIAGLICFNAFTTVSSCAFNSWKRDIVPDQRMGAFYARRLMLATLVGAVVTLAAGLGLDAGERWFADPSRLFSLLFAGGAVAGMAGVLFLSRVPEPMMSPPGDRSLWKTLTEPLRDANYRNLVTFLASWNFAANFAAPFMTVYLIRRLDLSMGWVLGLTALSQMTNMAALGMWGGIADRFSNKVVLATSGWLFALTLLLWPFTTLPERHVLTVPLLVLIHALAGIALAGVNLCAGGIALKLAPRGKATAFLAMNALISGAAATLAPSMAGLVADGLSDQVLTFGLHWGSASAAALELTPLDFRGLDFLFAIAFVLSLYALHRLLAVQELGSVGEEDVAMDFYSGLRRLARPGSIAGLRQLSQFPFAALRLPPQSETRRPTREPGDGEDEAEGPA